jgi:hypothetical protein
MTAKIVTRERVLELLTYCPASGIFTRNTAVSGRPAGSQAGAITRNGYLQISIDGTLIYAHRLAWFVCYGYFPRVADHVNRNRLDNRIANLRDVTPKQNAENSKHYKNNTSGYKGVMWDRRYQKWVAIVNHNGRRVYVGRFVDVYDAHQAYTRKVAELFTCR